MQLENYREGVHKKYGLFVSFTFCYSLLLVLLLGSVSWFSTSQKSVKLMWRTRPIRTIANTKCDGESNISHINAQRFAFAVSVNVPLAPILLYQLNARPSMRQLNEVLIHIDDFWVKKKTLERCSLQRPCLGFSERFAVLLTKISQISARWD